MVGAQAAMNPTEQASTAGRSLGAAVFWAVTLACAAAYWVNVGVVLDDAYVYLRVAENMAHTGKPLFNADDTFNITTSPLWMLVVSGLAIATPVGALVLACKFVFVACLIGASRLLAGVVRSESSILAGLSAAPIFFSASMPTLAGMETGLCLLTAVGLIWSFRRDDQWTPIWAALFYLSRPEGAVLGIVIAGAVFVRALLRKSVVVDLKRYAVSLAIAIVLAGAWHVWYWLQFHSLTPATANIKTMQGHSGWSKFAESWSLHTSLVYDPKDHWWFNALRAPTAILGLAALAWKRWELVVWPVLHFAVFAALGVAYYHWYFYPIDFVLALSVVTGMAVVLQAGVRLAGRKRAGVLAALATLALFPAVVFGLPNSRTATLASIGLRPGPAFPDTRFAAYADLAKTMSDSMGGKPFTLLSHEIGVFGFLMPTASVRDVVGLATPISSPKDLWNWQKQIAAFEPDFLLWPFPNPQHTRAFERANGSPIAYVILQAEGGYTLYRRLDPTNPEDAKTADALDRVVKLRAGLISAGAPADPVDIEGEIALFTHAPAKLIVARPDGAAGALVGFGYRPDAWAPGNAPDGARFLFKDADTGAVLFQQVLDPIGHESDRGPRKVVIPAPGKQLEISIDTLSSSNWDWTYLLPPVWLAPEAYESSRSTGGIAVAASAWDGTCPTAQAVTARLDRNRLAGWVDEATARPGGRTFLRGWAADIAHGSPARMVVVMRDGKVVGCGPTGGARPDVAQAEKSPGLESSGFGFEVPGVLAQAAGLRDSVLAQMADGAFATVSVR